jgi:hypothetical protein
MDDQLGGGEAHWELNVMQAAQEKNTENRLIIRDRRLTKHSMQNGQAHLMRSPPHQAEAVVQQLRNEEADQAAI